MRGTLPAFWGTELLESGMLAENRPARTHVVVSTAARRRLRLPLEGALDLTYRCNNDCVHCWIRLPPDAPERDAELGLEEIQRIVREARRWGCQEWGLSGGEPMLRPDFSEIFDWLTRQCRHYILNTNGTLITPAIARLLTRPGSKLVALYGATAEVHDRVTRHPGSFEMTMRGIAYLREAGAAFTVQVIPMRANWEQYPDMLRLAETLSPSVRMGAPWLYLSAGRDAARNCSIAAQRLPPEELPRLDPPDMTVADLEAGTANGPCGVPAGDDRLLAPCTAHGHRFYITPTGRMTFCCFAQDAALQYDLRRGSFAEAWERFLPDLAERIRGGQEYAKGCGACELRRYCRWCPLYGYLEHGRYAAKVEYLCAAARATRRQHEEWSRQHRRYYRAAGITFRVDSDLPFAEDTLAPKFAAFRVAGPGDDTVTLRHRFQLPPLRGRDLGPVVYDRPPWRIHRLGQAWVFLCGMNSPEPDSAYQVAVFSGDFRSGRLYHRDAERFRHGGNHSLTLWATDQVLMGQLLAERQGGFVHASGVIRNGRGLLLAGHTGAGKTTLMQLLAGWAEWVTDDRMIVRHWPEGFRMHGSWNHGEIPQVSPAEAPLAAILFLNQAPRNLLEPVTDKSVAVRRLLALWIKPLMTGEWWRKSLAVIQALVAEVPCYVLHFERSEAVRQVLTEHFG